MIYLNNGATSWPKPSCVSDAVKKSIDNLPSSAHRSGFEEEEEYNCKELLAKLLKIEDANNIVYASNATYALNLAIQGFEFNKGDKVLTTAAEHNSVLRPLYYLQNKNIIEYEICQKEGFNETIFLNEKGFVAEGCTTNVFIIKDNKIFTPKISCGLLPGIIRGWVISNFEVVEKEITKEELLNSDEIFLTNSLVGIIGVSKLDDIKFDISYSREIREKYEDVINGGDK